MTPDDVQIDVLLRRHAEQAQRGNSGEHLDADELNAFAEGSLPAAARSRYVSHLADCDDCRKVASQLAITGGSVIAAEAVKVADPQSSSWWKSLSGFFSPLKLRYAAFAMVLIVVAGIAFIVYRRPSPGPALVAQNEQSKPESLSALKPTNEGSSQNSQTQSKQVPADRSAPNTQPSQSSDQLLKADQSKLGETTPLPKPAKEMDTASSPASAAKKVAEPGVASPSYAPPPPAESERAEVRSREQQNVGGITTMSAPRKSEQATDKAQAINGARGGEGKDLRADDENRRLIASQPASRGPADEKSKGSLKDLDKLAANNRSSNEARGGASKTPPAAAANTESEEKTPEIRSVGGRKFKRQGNAWVDSKFKSSMALKTISRGSGEFDALDSGLRSIAQQISGEVIVVWKSKAYLIR